MLEVGQKSLELLKRIEEMVSEETNGQFQVRFGGFWISPVGKYHAEQEEVTPIMESLEEAGFVPKVKHDQYETKYYFHHEDLNEWAYIRVEHEPTEADKIKALEAEQAKITAKLEELNNKLLGVKA